MKVDHEYHGITEATADAADAEWEAHAEIRAAQELAVRIIETMEPSFDPYIVHSTD